MVYYKYQKGIKPMRIQSLKDYRNNTGTILEQIVCKSCDPWNTSQDSQPLLQKKLSRNLVIAFYIIVIH